MKALRGRTTMLVKLLQLIALAGVIFGAIAASAYGVAGTAVSAAVAIGLLVLILAWNRRGSRAVPKPGIAFVRPRNRS